MKPSPSCLSTLYFLTLLLCAVNASDPAGLSGSTDTALGEPLQNAEQNDEAGLSEQQPFEPVDDPGDGAVREAYTLLHRIKSPTRRVLSYSKPSGLFGTIAYYLRELFMLLFMNGPSSSETEKPSSPSFKLTGHLHDAVVLLNMAAEVENADAIFTLAEMNFYGRYSHPRNYTEAFRRYQRLADLNGNSTAQHMVGFMYATGIGGAVERDQAKAFVYHKFAADGGNTQSQMTTAFRHHAGISTPRSCEPALHYYKKVADKAVKYLRSGPPGGHNPKKEANRLADEEGGVYGEGASFSSAGKNAKGGPPNSDANAAFDDVLEYLDLMSRKGELRATFGLGRLHYDGSRALNQDFRLAMEYFLDVARRYWTKDGKIKADTEIGVDKLASKAAGYLGRMFLRGEGVQQDFEKAKIWFGRGIANGDSLCQYSMGLMYLYGLGVPQDPVKAADLFKPSADQNHPPSQVRLGALHLDQGDVKIATKYFELAAHNGHIEALYYLAELNNFAPTENRNCDAAAVYYKMVAEKVEIIHSSFAEANIAYENGDLETALPLYMMAAEQGYEVGQANVAYLLDKSQRRSPVTKFLPTVRRKIGAILNDAALALIYWTRSAKQHNVDSMVRLGDYYLLGLGTPGSQPDSEKAATCYQTAADMMQSAQAMWNLGWMHENGIGVEQDFHLAKRYYDQSADTNKESYAPVALALMKLRFRGWWDWISGGKVNQIKDEGDKRKPYSFREWVTTFVQADLEQYEAQLAQEEAAAAGPTVDEWQTGSAGHMRGQDDIYAEFDEESILETLAIVGLALALAFLVYWRQQRHTQFRRRAEEDQRQQGQGAQPGQAAPAQDRGMFPAPDNPEFNNWVAGGIGH